MNHFIISQVDLSDAKKAAAECRLRLKHLQAGTVKQADAKEFITDALNRISAVLDCAIIQNPPNQRRINQRNLVEGHKRKKTICS